MFMKLLELLGLIVFVVILAIIFTIKLLFKFVKFLWTFTPWVRARKRLEFEQEIEEDRQYRLYVETLKNGWISRINPLIYIDGKIKYIYVYTTDTEKVFNRYKIGETKKSPFDRIQEQDTTSNSAELQLVAYWHAGKISDKEIHKILEALGYTRIRSNREWFIIDDPIKVIPEILAEGNK